MDTGAEVTAITEETFQHLQPSQIFTPSKTLYGPLQCPLNTVGKFPGTLSHQGKSTVQPVFVVNSLKTNLLGLPAITSLELTIRINSTEKVQHLLNKRLQDVSECVYGLGKLGGTLWHPPKRRIPNTPNRVPLPLRKKFIKAELDMMEQIGVISRVDEPTEWFAPMVVVPNKDGKIGICVDLKPLNQCVLRDSSFSQGWWNPGSAIRGQKLQQIGCQ